MTLPDWTSVTRLALQDTWQRVISYLPNLLGALVILIVGILIANILRWIIQRIVDATRLQLGFDQLDFAKALRAANMSTSLGTIIGEFVRWVVIILFLLPAASVLGLPQISGILYDFVRYLPSVGSAVIILFLGVLVAEFLGNIVRATAAGLGSHTAAGLSALSRYVIYIFSGLVALSQLGIAPQVINILITGFVAAAAIASGLAFGLGGKDAASDLIARIRSDFSK